MRDGMRGVILTQWACAQEAVKAFMTADAQKRERRQLEKFVKLNVQQISGTQQQVGASSRRHIWPVSDSRRCLLHAVACRGLVTVLCITGSLRCGARAHFVKPRSGLAQAARLRRRLQISHARWCSFWAAWRASGAHTRACSWLPH